MRYSALIVMLVSITATLVACGPAQLSSEQAGEVLIEAATQKLYTIDVPVGDVAFVHQPDAGEGFPAAKIMTIARNLRDENGYLDFAACTEIRSGFYRIRANRQCSISLTDAGEIAFGRVPDVTIDPGVHLVEAQHWLRPTLATTEIVGIGTITPDESGAGASFKWRWMRTEFGKATAGWDGLETEDLREGKALFRLDGGVWLVEEIDW